MSDPLSLSRYGCDTRSRLQSILHTGLRPPRFSEYALYWKPRVFNIQ